MKIFIMNLTLEFKKGTNQIAPICSNLVQILQLEYKQMLMETNRAKLNTQIKFAYKLNQKPFATNEQCL
jgi:hypothetical protein